MTTCSLQKRRTKIILTGLKTLIEQVTTFIFRKEQKLC